MSGSGTCRLDSPAGLSEGLHGLLCRAVITKRHAGQTSRGVGLLGSEAGFRNSAEDPLRRGNDAPPRDRKARRLTRDQMGLHIENDLQSASQRRTSGSGQPAVSWSSCRQLKIPAPEATLPWLLKRLCRTTSLKGSTTMSTMSPPSLNESLLPLSMRTRSSNNLHSASLSNPVFPPRTSGSQHRRSPIPSYYPYGPTETSGKIILNLQCAACISPFREITRE